MDTSKCTSKMRAIYLKLHNEPILNALAEKKKSVYAHKKSMISKSKKLKELKVEPIVRITCVLVAQIMTSNDKNIDNLEIYCKQCLNELHHID